MAVAVWGECRGWDLPGKARRAALAQPEPCCINPFVTSHLVNDDEPASLSSFDPTAVYRPKRD